MRLVAITREGKPLSKVPELPEVALSVLQSTQELYEVAGYVPPWLGYLAIDAGQCVGTCAFKSAPVDGRVEIAYFTFPPHEGRGVATSMANSLIGLTRMYAPGTQVFARTLAESNASTRILEKLGFRRTAVLEHPEDGTIWEWELSSLENP